MDDGFKKHGRFYIILVILFFQSNYFQKQAIALESICISVDLNFFIHEPLDLPQGFATLDEYLRTVLDLSDTHLSLDPSMSPVIRRVKSALHILKTLEWEGHEKAALWRRFKSIIRELDHRWNFEAHYGENGSFIFQGPLRLEGGMHHTLIISTDGEIWSGTHPKL
jgi:hypothetical protein